ncbi:hypothetical protein OG339_48575 (plasmid) [Streptosporangium sp. NBC_01495]|uniref:hypothetical protein n=1 Tax=Streptosporangium sp. NBC_01495 TaxID=2903899 RepID=UPI002E35742F|nr:hypothetical protein [Streptosporangium sp. NBC_01495]
MSRKQHKISVILYIDPSEHPAEGAVWDLLVAGVEQAAADLAADPRLTGNPRLRSLADDLACVEIEVDQGYNINPKVLDIREGQKVVFRRSATDRHTPMADHLALTAIVVDEPCHGEHGITVDVTVDGTIRTAALDSMEVLEEPR